MLGFGIVVGEVLPQDVGAGIRLDVGGDHAGDPAEVIIGIGHAAGALADGGHTVAPVIGIDRAAGVAVDILVQTGDEVLLVVGVLQRDLVIGAGLSVEHVPVHKIGGKACGDPGRGVRYGGQRAGIVVGIGEGRAVLVGLTDDPALTVVGIFHEIGIAVGHFLQVTVPVAGILVRCQCLRANGNACALRERAVGEVVRGGGGAPSVWC